MVQLLSHFLIHATKFIWWEDFGCVPKPIHQGMILYKWKREPEGQSTREQAERWRIKNERGCSRLIVLRMTFELLKFSLSPHHQHDMIHQWLQWVGDSFSIYHNFERGKSMTADTIWDDPKTNIRHSNALRLRLAWYIKRCALGNYWQSRLGLTDIEL